MEWLFLGTRLLYHMWLIYSFDDVFIDLECVIGWTKDTLHLFWQLSWILVWENHILIWGDKIWENEWENICFYQRLWLQCHSNFLSTGLDDFVVRFRYTCFVIFTSHPYLTQCLFTYKIWVIKIFVDWYIIVCYHSTHFIYKSIYWLLFSRRTVIITFVIRNS